MASIIDSIKTVVGDSHPFFKMAALSLIILLVIQLNAVAGVEPIWKITAMVLAFLSVLGFALISVHNTVNEHNILLPNLFNPINLIWVGLKGFMSLLPFLALVYWGMASVIPILKLEPWVNYIIIVMLFVVLSSFFVVSMLLFCKRFNSLASYNFKNIFKYSGDFITYNFGLAFNILILVTVVFFPVGLVVKLMFDFGLVFDYYLIFSIIFVAMCMLQYYSQLYFEFIDLSDT